MERVSLNDLAVESKTWGEFIKKLCDVLGISAKTLSQVAGVCVQNVYNWKSGLYGPSRNSIFRIAAEYGIDPMNLMKLNSYETTYTLPNGTIVMKYK